MKIKFILHIIIFSIIIIFICSCRDRCSKYVTIDIENENAKSYFNYNKNSYWIYTDTTGQIIDTFTVIDLQKEYIKDNKPFSYRKCYNLELITCKIIDKNNNQIKISARVKDKDDRKTVIYYITSNIGATIICDDDNNSCDYQYATILDSLKINGNTYYGVIKTVRDMNEIYVVKNIGIVKYVNTDTIYNLLNYVIQ